ncbi:MAG: GGDEF domain-containing protein [Nitrospira sp.]|nr:MAG: GGDEF domain-containing protein [Nitrospira sp.]
MLFNTILKSASDIFGQSLNGWKSGAEFPAIVMSPLVAIIGICLIGLLILGGLWWKSWYQGAGFDRSRSTEKSSERTSTYDYVTGLPTRRLFGTLLDQTIDRAAKAGRSFALLVVELEHFRMVAESEGQANGNVLVRVQAARVKGVLRSTETVARLARDQFAVILDNLDSQQEIMTTVEKLQSTIGLPLTLEGHELFLTCRIGVALYPQDARECEGLIDQAMKAVKAAKSEGQTVQFTSPLASVDTPDSTSATASLADRRR